MDFHGLNLLCEAGFLLSEEGASARPRLEWTDEERVRLNRGIVRLHEEGHTLWRIAHVAKTISERNWLPGRSERGIEKRLYKKEHRELLEKCAKAPPWPQELLEVDALISRVFCRSLPFQIHAGRLFGRDPLDRASVLGALNEIREDFQLYGTNEDLFRHMTETCKSCCAVWNKVVEAKRIEREENRKIIDEWHATFRKREERQQTAAGDRTPRAKRSKTLKKNRKKV